HVSTPQVGSYAAQACPTAPSKGAVGPGTYNGLPALKRTGSNGPDGDRGIRSAHLTRELLLAQWNSEIDVGKHPWLSNRPQNGAPEKGRPITLSPGIRVGPGHYKQETRHILTSDRPGAVVQIRDDGSLPLHIQAEHGHKDQLHVGAGYRSSLCETGLPKRWAA